MTVQADSKHTRTMTAMMIRLMMMMMMMMMIVNDLKPGVSAVRI